MLKRAAAAAGITPKYSARWLRPAHASHAIDRGAALPAGNAGAWQHIGDQRLSACAARRLQRAASILGCSSTALAREAKHWCEIAGPRHTQSLSNEKPYEHFP